MFPEIWLKKKEINILRIVVLSKNLFVTAKHEMK